MRNRSKKIVSTAALCVLLVVLLGVVVQLQRRHFTHSAQIRTYEEKLVLPNSAKLKLVSLGFDNLYADLLWLRAIQAFGSRWEAGGNMSPIFHYFDVVTDLDPRFIEAYKLGNLVIGDEGGDYQRSLDILRKGMLKNPSNWDLPYLGIYNAVWQMEDYKQARWFAFMAAKVPNRPEFVARMQEYVERQTGRTDTAYRMNLEYLLQYLETGNKIEARLATLRFEDILDRWYRNEMIEAARRFIAENDRDPRSMEELIASPAWEPFTAPTLDRLRQVIDVYRERGIPLLGSLEKIAEQSMVRIEGVPPEPTGFEYRIVEDLIPKNDEGTSGTLAVTADNAETLPVSHFRYIANIGEIQDALLNYLSGMNMKIQEFRNEHGRYPGSLEELVDGNFNYVDPLGGTFVYDPETGMLKSTGFDDLGPRPKKSFIE